MEWTQLLGVVLALLVVGWFCFRPIWRFAKLQEELETRRESERRALAAMYERIYGEALARGDRDSAHAIQLQAFRLGVDVAKGGSWSHGS